MKIAVLRQIDFYLGKILTIAFKPILLFKKGNPENVNIKKILLIKFWGLGNLTLIWPLVDKIKEKYPHAFIYFLTFDIHRDFLERNRNLGKIIYCEFTKNIFKIMWQFLHILIHFKKEKLDLVINFETLNNISALFSYFTKAPLRIGLNNRYEKFLYNHRVDNNHTLHISQVFLNLLKPIGINSSYSYYCFGEFKEDDIIRYQDDYGRVKQQV